jgi:hypothetical protein
MILFEKWVEINLLVFALFLNVCMHVQGTSINDNVIDYFQNLSCRKAQP